MMSVRDILSRKAPGRYVPSCLIHFLEHIVHQDEVNAILSRSGDLRGVTFIRRVLHEELGLSVRVEHEERIPKGDQPLIFVSNHPLGGADGMLLLELLTRLRGRRVRVIVNDLLMNIQPLAELFVPVNKVGDQRREYVARQRELWGSGDDVLTFPAGACSRRQKGGEIADLAWKDSFVRRAVEYKRDVVPLYFEGRNSKFFYRLAYWRKRLGIQLNIEMLYLADELFKARGKEFVVRVGEPIRWEALSTSRSSKQWAQEIQVLTNKMTQ